MEFSKPLMLNTQMFEQQFGKPFYDDFQTFWDECFTDARAYVPDKCLDRVCEYYWIWEDLNVWDIVSDLGNDVLEEMKACAQQEFNRIKDETEDIDFDPAETPYIQIDVPSDEDVFNSYLDACQAEDVDADLFEEISDILCNMLDDIYSTGELTDSEEEYLMQSIDEYVGENPDTMINIAKNNNLEQLKAYTDKELEEYRG